MSEKPQQTRPGSPEIDMLNEIMDRAMPHIPDPPEEGPIESQGIAGTEHISDEISGEEASALEKPASPPLEKNKRSSVYVYLAVLFGAAFLMLLLAYFVQQRNNANVQDDLRSITASRQELLEDIQRLENENESLQQDNQLLNMRLEQVKEEREQLKSQLDDYYYSTSEQRIRIALSNGLDYLERFIEAKDWLMAGALIESMDNRYNEHNVDYVDIGVDLTPSQTARYFELREGVFDKGGIMVMETFTTTEDGSDYTERPYIGENIFDETDYKTARSLLSVILYYPHSLDIPAGFLFEYFRSTGSSLERLNTGAFQPSTVELYQQIRADVIAAGELMELNGELTGIPSGADSGEDSGWFESFT